MTWWCRVAVFACALVTAVSGQVPATGTIAGTVTHADGSPAAGMTVTPVAVEQLPQAVEVRAARTDAGGAYRIEGLPPGRYVVAAALGDRPVYNPGVATTDEAEVIVVGHGTAAGSMDIRLIELPQYRVEGHVMPHVPAPPAAAYTVHLAGPARINRAAPVEPDGQFAFEGVPPGTYSLRVEPDPIGLSSASIVVSDRDLTGLTLVALASQTVGGQVTVDGDGRLPVLALVFASPWGNRPVWVGPDGQFTATLALGEHRMVLTGVPSTHEVASASSGATDLLVSPLTVDGAGAPDVRIVLRAATGERAIRGRVIDRNLASSRTPVRVTARSPRLYAIADVEAGPDGTFEIPRLPPGTYDLLTGPGEAYEAVQVIVGDSDVDDVALVRPAQVRVDGRMLLDRDAPMPQPVIAFVRPLGTIRAPVTPDGRFTVTLPEGAHRVAVSLLPAGYSLRAIAHGDADLLAEPFLVRDSGPVDVAVRVDVDASVQPVRVSGRVVGLDGRPEAETRVHLSGAGAGVAPQESPIAGGRFAFAQVLPGSYRLSLRSPPGTGPPPADPFPIEVRTSDVSDLELRVLPLTVVRGVVEVEGDAPLPSISLRFSGPGHLTSIGNLGGPPDSLSGSLTPGRHQVSVSGISAGYELASIHAGETDLLRQPLLVTEGGPVNLRVRVRTTQSFVEVSGRIVLRDLAETLPAAVRLERPAPQTLAADGAIVLTRFVGPGSTPLEFQPRVPEAAVEVDGSFRFRGVLPGSYVLRFEGSRRVPSTVITVGRDDVRDLEIVSPREVAIDGHVQLAGGGPLLRPRVLLTLEPDGAGGPVDAVSSTYASESDSVFHLMAHEGRYRVQVQPLPPGYIVESIRIGDRDVTGTSVDVEPGLPPIVVSVRAPASAPWRRVEGRIVNDERPGLTGRQTLQLERVEGPQVQRLEATVATDGSFILPAVLPGEYRATWLTSSRLRLAGQPAPDDRRGPVIRVADTDVLDVELERFEDTVVVPVRVVVDSPGPRPSIVLANASSVSAWTGDIFSVGMLLGEQRVSVARLSEGFELTGLRYGDVDLLRDPGTFTAASMETIEVSIRFTGSLPLRSVGGRVGDLERLSTDLDVVTLSAVDGSIRPYSTPLGPEGSFTFTGVLAREYGISARSSIDDWVYAELGMVVVDDEDISNLVLDPPYTVPVVIRASGAVDDSAAADVLQPGLQVYDPGGRRKPGGAPPVSSLLLRDGDRVMPGRLPPGHVVDSLTFGSTDLLRDPIRLPAAEGTVIRATVRRTVDSPAPDFHLRGRVEPWAPGPSGRVRLSFPGRAATRDARIADDGTFEFEGLPRGVYELWVADWWWLAARVVVSDRAVSNVVLQAAP